MVQRRRLSLFGQVARLPDNIPVKAILHVACDVRNGVPPFPNWRRPWGRPPVTWLHQTCSDCSLSAGDALNCAQDRVVWRKYATASLDLCGRRRYPQLVEKGLAAFLISREPYTAFWASLIHAVWLCLHIALISFNSDGRVYNTELITN